MNKQTRAAQIRSNSFDADANTIDIVWTTGAAVRRCDWDGTEYDEVLSLEPGAVRLERLNAGAPLLDTHNSENLGDVIGAVVEGSARIEAGRGIATVLLSQARSDADTISKIRDGVIKNISTGYWVHRVEKSEGSSGIARWDVVDWEPLEVSAVPIPADPGAQFRSLRGSRSARKPMTKEQRDYQAGAAQATRHLGKDGQSLPASRDHIAGATMARRLLGSAPIAGKVRVESAKPAVIDKLEVELGARAARRLLRKRA